MDYCGVCGTVLFFLRWMDCEAVLDLFRFIRLDSKWDANSELVVGVEMLVYSQDKSRWTTSYKFWLSSCWVLDLPFWVDSRNSCFVSSIDIVWFVPAKGTFGRKRNRHALLDQWKSSTNKTGTFRFVFLDDTRLFTKKSTRKTSAITYALCRDRKVSLAIVIQNVLLNRHPPLIGAFCPGVPWTFL